MLKKGKLLVVLFLASHLSYSQTSVQTFLFAADTELQRENTPVFTRQFTATADFLDAAINSLNSFNSLIKKRKLSDQDHFLQ